MDLDAPYWLILAVVPVFLLVGWALNFRRGRRWEQRRRDQGSVHCRACGHVGEPQVRSLTSENASSANLRLVCAHCESPDWFIPDDEKAA